MASMIVAFDKFQVSENFEDYIERLEEYVKFHEVPAERVVSLFLTSIGADTYKTLKNLVAPDKPASKSYNDLIEALKKHLCPRKIIIAERYKFYTAIQGSGESIASYIVKLRQLANSCDFRNFLDEALRDRLVCGMARADIRYKLLAEVELNFTKASEMALAMEVRESESQMIQINQEVKSAMSEGNVRDVHAIKGFHSRPQKEKSAQDSGKIVRSDCFRCGRKHNPINCPAKQWKCYTCQKIGHTSFKCRGKVGYVAEHEQEDNFEILGHIIGEEIKRDEKHQPEYIKVQVNDKMVIFEIDSGAGRSIMSLKEFEKLFPNVKIETNKPQLRGVSGEKLKVIGSAIMEVKMKGRSETLPVVITQSEINFRPLMGRDWLDRLIPTWRQTLKIQEIQTVIENKGRELVQELQETYPKVFSKDRSKCIEGVTANLVIQEKVHPIFHRPYTVPYAIKAEVESELQQMVKSGILESVRYSEWASPIVPVPRKNGGKIRLCVDCKVTVNPVLKTDQYPLPLFEDILQTIKGGKYFTLLDLSNAYQQLQLNEESKKLLTINTHLGLYAFTRLPYGVASAPAQFQAAMDHILRGLPMTACYIDDLIVAGRDKQDCVENVKRVMSRLSERNVRVNLDKCRFLCKEIEFLGHHLDANGIKPLQSKIQAIQQAKAPKDLQQLRSFLGLINYYRKFIPMMATLMKPLYDLEKKGSIFNWSKECQAVFEKSKQVLIDSPALTYFDQKKTIVITVDASPYGVGAVLNHRENGEEKPVMFASRTLSEAEKNYAQIQREALALIFAVKHFHKYIYGKKFTLVSDHKPLQTILGPKNNIPTLAASRLQRWAIILSAYEYQLEYRKGEEMAPADALSRLPLEIRDESEEVFFLSEFQEPLTALQVKERSQEDAVLKSVVRYTKEGWPNKIEESFKPYFRRYNELSVEKECLFWGNRLIIPYQLRHEVLKLLHDQHIGVVKMKMLARSEVWWPRIDEEIENHVLKCEACQVNQRKLEVITDTTWPKTVRNYQRVHIDFLQKGGNYFLLIVDSHSKWLDIHIMTSGTNAEKTIEKLRGSFIYFGLPEEVVSDNGPPFNGKEYKQFCSVNGIRCTLTPPNHPKSNGFAEKQVSTIKRNLMKQLYENKGNVNLQKQIDNFLFVYRNTPNISTGLSPAEMMIRRKPRTRLSLLRFTEENRNSKKEMKNLRSFVEDQKVLCYFERNSPQWSKGRIVKVVSPLTYWVIVNGVTRLMHADHLRASHLEEAKTWQTGEQSVEKEERVTIEEERLDAVEREEERIVESIDKQPCEEGSRELRRSQRKVEPPKRLICEQT